MLCSFASPYRRLTSIKHITSTSTTSRSLANKVGGRVLDGFNGNVLQNVTFHGDTTPKAKISYESRKAAILKKQTDALKRFIPKPVYGKALSNGIKTKDMKFSSKYEVDRFILDDLSRSSPRNIADVMHTSVKVTKKLQKLSYLSPHLLTIAVKLKGISADQWCFRDISTIVYGLQCYREEEEGVIDILTVMTEMASYGVTNKWPLKSQDVSMLLLGLQAMGTKKIETRNLLSVITTMVRGCGNNFDEQNIGNALVGLQMMSSDCIEVRSLLSALTIKVRDSPFEMSSQSVSNALYGLQGMSSDYIEVRELLSELAIKIKKFKPELSAQALSKSLFGLQGMSSEHSEVCDIVAALAVKARHSVKHLNSQEFGDAVFGLQGMSSEKKEVRELLSVLSYKLKHCTDDFTGKALCETLYGLQGCTYVTPESQESKALLSEVAVKILDFKGRLSSRDIGNALYGLYGLRGVISDSEYISILKLLFENVNRIVYIEDGLIPQLDGLVLSSLLTLRENIALALSELKIIFKKNMNHYKSWEKLNRSFSDEITARRRNGNEYFTEKEFEQFAEKKMFLVSQKILMSSDIIVKCNDYLFDAFKSDFIYKIPVENIINKEEKSILIVNIEIDGSYHSKNKNKSYCRRKDIYLASKGVIVLRILSSTVISMSKEELEEWILTNIRKAKAQYSFSILGLTDEVNAINAL